MAETDQYKVKLISSTNRAEQVHFDVTPEVNETTNVNYQTVDPLHAPGQVFAYTNTNSRTFNISGIRLISRTVNEANLNLARLWTLRGWTKSVFGQTTLDPIQRLNRSAIRSFSEGEYSTEAVRSGDSNDNDIPDSIDRAIKNRGVELRGKPPEVVLLSAYSRAGSFGNTPEHINRVPCVIEQLSIPYPSDTDYINTSTGVPMPTIMSLDLVLRESHSPNEYSNFNLSSFKRGVLGGF